jgi:hypothetical protein
MPRKGSPPSLRVFITSARGFELFASAVEDGLLSTQNAWLIVPRSIKMTWRLHGLDARYATRSGTRTNAREV